MKKEARLTGLLLARKGTAVPSPASVGMVRPAFEQFEGAKEYYGHADIGLTAPEELSSDEHAEEALNVAAQTVRKLSAIREDSVRNDDQNDDLNDSASDESDENRNLVLQKKSVGKTKVFGKVRSKKSTIDSQETTANIKKSNRITSIVATKNQTATKRIAMTLRMDGSEHLKLRLFSAYSKNSCQKILTEALDYYLENNPHAKKFSDQISVG